MLLRKLNKSNTGENGVKKVSYGWYSTPEGLVEEQIPEPGAARVQIPARPLKRW